jgi:hypothetical protein
MACLLQETPHYEYRNRPAAATPRRFGPPPDPELAAIAANLLALGTDPPALTRGEVAHADVRLAVWAEVLTGR